MRSSNSITMKRRIVYFCLSIFCFMLCVFIVKLFSNIPFVRGFIGDIVVISLIYFLLKGFYDFHERKLTCFILIIAFTTEFLQFLKLTTYLGLENNKVAQLVLGSVFDPYDLLAYTIGAIFTYFIDTRLVKFILAKS